MRNSASPMSIMQPNPTRWQTVMFDPLAYIHPERLQLPAGFESPAQRAALNRLLMAHFELDAGQFAAQPATQAAAHEDVQETAAEKLLLKHWFHLPQIVFLLGCQRLRLALSRRGAMLQLPAAAQAFMTLPLLPPVQYTPAADIPGRAVLMRQGLRQLLLGLGLDAFPAGLARRLPLLFAPAIDAVAEPEYQMEETAGIAGGTRDPAHALTLTMAIQHVKRYPIDTE
jgi:type III secretion system OrgA/MxiK family protein